MLSRLRAACLALVTLVLSCGTLQGCCPRIPPVPPKVTCPLPPSPEPVSLSPGSVGDPATGTDLVTLTPAEAVDLGLYLRREAAWHRVAAACLGVTP